MKVLIAEDDAVSRTILRRAVEKTGHKCLAAADGQEAWGLYKENPDLDVIISDWMMPGVDGLELCRRVRADGQEGYTYFIFLTALGDKEHLLQGLEVGADDYLSKPLDRDELGMRLISARRLTAQEVDHGGAITYVSPQIKGTLGYTPEEYVSDHDLWYRLIHPEDRERVLPEDEWTDRTEEPFKVAYRMLARDGREVWVRDENTVEKKLPFDATAGFHEYRIDLYPTRAEFSVDGRLLHTFDEGLPGDSMQLMVNAWYPDWLPGEEPEKDGHVQVDWIQR